MALVKLGDKAVGSTVKLKVNGAAREFIIVHQGLPGSMYDESCNGTWLLIKDPYENSRPWHSSEINDYANSTIHTYLNSTILNLFDADIRAQIKQAKIPYRPSSGTNGKVNSGANGLAAKIFLLSVRELGFIDGNYKGMPVDGEKLDYFESGNGTSAANKRVAMFNGKGVIWWLRSPYLGSGGGTVWNCVSNGDAGRGYPSGPCALRFALILPSTLMVSDDGSVSTNTAPTAPSTITIPSQINGGSTITVEWGAATDAEDNMEGYIVQRSVDGGSSWAQIYQGGAISTTNTVPFGSESVMYRVKAYDTEGFESGWKTSSQVTVINNTAPTVPGHITVPEQVQGGQPLAISWGASSDGENNLAGYSLERQADGGDWAVVYSGAELGFTDAITKGWQTVAYRVRAYDTHNAYSGFAFSETREVNNNTPPAITCEYPASSSLGTKSEGFGVTYSVADEEGDEVTVTEAVDGAAVRTFTVELGEENSFQLDGETFMRLLNGTHTLAITAGDGKSSAVHRLTFAKLVTAASVTLEQPMSADGPITVCVLSVSGSIPLDAEYMVEVTNNALDDEPVWEDCTAAVRSGINHIFENETAENGFAFNFRLHVSRGNSGVGGYITSVQGGFQ